MLFFFFDLFLHVESPLQRLYYDFEVFPCTLCDIVSQFDFSLIIFIIKKQLVLPCNLINKPKDSRLSQKLPFYIFDLLLHDKRPNFSVYYVF